jgi:hypothetical protein|tara:strand:+ start:329 stop:442 length:114 start_codon:yes stop_codon:yes gene_type:complete
MIIAILISRNGTGAGGIACWWKMMTDPLGAVLVEDDD